MERVSMLKYTKRFLANSSSLIQNEKPNNELCSDKL